MTTRLSDCIYCGRPLKFPLDKPVVVCPGCQTKNKYPDERVLNRAEFRNAREQQRRDEFCDAEESYLRVLNDFPDDADALWGRLLCHYGAKLIVGAGEKRRYAIRIPRSKPLRAQGDYERAIENALPEMREQYEQDAAYIDRAMEAIRTTAATKPPYDIFLCHKTTPIGGRGYTEDYVRARDLHDLLTAEGYNAFFAPVDMANVSGGEDYEAGIYHALNTAKVMLVVCSDPAHLDATWVKSEWQRFLALRDEGKQVALIPLLYGGMRASALPRAFQVRNLQAITVELKGESIVLQRLAELIPPETTASVDVAPPKKLGNPILKGALVLCLLAALLVGASFVYAKKNDMKWPQDVIEKIIGKADDQADEPKPTSSASPTPTEWLSPAPTTATPASTTATPAPTTATPAPTTATPAPTTATPAPTLVSKGKYVEGGYKIDVYSDGTCEIVGYTGSDAVLVVPAKLDGCVVTSIGDAAFMQCDSLTSVTLPDSVTNIGDSAFCNCESLTSITLPDGLTSIGNLAFYVCYSLTSITLPDGLTSIGNEAFFACLPLTSLTLPASVTSIGAWAFDACTILTLRVPRNSYAAAYAQENNIPYTYID